LARAGAPWVTPSSRFLGGEKLGRPTTIARRQARAAWRDACRARIPARLYSALESVWVRVANVGDPFEMRSAAIRPSPSRYLAVRPTDFLRYPSIWGLDVEGRPRAETAPRLRRGGGTTTSRPSWRRCEGGDEPPIFRMVTDRSRRLTARRVSFSTLRRSGQR